jgi:hypothetical protein
MKSLRMAGATTETRTEHYRYKYRALPLRSLLATCFMLEATYSPKRRLALNGLHCFISQEAELFIINPVKISDTPVTCSRLHIRVVFTLGAARFIGRTIQQ